MPILALNTQRYFAIGGWAWQEPVLVSHRMVLCHVTMRMRDKDILPNGHGRFGIFARQTGGQKSFLRLILSLLVTEEFFLRQVAHGIETERKLF